MVQITGQAADAGAAISPEDQALYNQMMTATAPPAVPAPTATSLLVPAAIAVGLVWLFVQVTR